MSSVLFVDNKTYRNFSSVLYPDSGLIDEFKKEVRYPCFISPLHDNDYQVDEDGVPTDELKKPHYHVLFCTDGLKGSTINKFLDRFHFVGGEPIKSRDGYIRYLIHKDDVDKAQYSIDDIVPLNTKIDYRGIINGVSHRSVTLVDSSISGYKSKYSLSTESLDDIMNLIQEWKLPYCDVSKVMGMGNYSIYESYINKWFKYRNEFTTHPLRDEVLTIYVTGKSRSGKTHFITHELIPYLQKTFNYTYCTCNNRFDNYNEQDVMYLTELRGNEHSLSEVCRLLDTSNNSPISRRYSDCTSYFLKVVIIDTLESLETLSESMLKDSKYDTVRQLERRIDLTIKCTCIGTRYLQEFYINDYTNLVDKCDSLIKGLNGIKVIPVDGSDLGFN